MTDQNSAPSRMIQWLTLLALGLLIWAGLKPQPFEQYITHFDKYTHTAGFFVLAVLCLCAFPRIPWQLTVLILFSLGAIIEVLQGALLPSRAFDLGDLAMNISGVLLALLVVMLVRTKFDRARLP